jgi:hypothetical protein
MKKLIWVAWILLTWPAHAQEFTDQAACLRDNNVCYSPDGKLWTPSLSGQARISPANSILAETSFVAHSSKNIESAPFVEKASILVAALNLLAGISVMVWFVGWGRKRF